MDLTQADNGGLAEIIDTVDTMWAPFCDLISKADFWALAGKVAVEVTATVDYEVPFRFGRRTADNCSYEGGRLPNAQLGIEEIERVFVTQMGLTVRDAAALLGAHTLGRMEARNSGFEGPWTNNPDVFDNNYFVTLTQNGWTKAVIDADHTTWVHVADDRQTIFLNVDMELSYNVADEEAGLTNCGPIGRDGSTRCIENRDVSSHAIEFGQNQAAWLAAFAVGYKKMTEVGYTDDDLCTVGATCSPCNACGSPTVRKLQDVSNADVVDGVAIGVKQMPDRRLVVELETPPGRIVTRYLVVATGGGGYHFNQTTYPRVVTLAEPANTGFQLNVATALNLTTVGHNAYYHLEWEKPGNGSWEARWFPTDLCKPNSSCVNASYSLCSDYSKRAQNYKAGANECSANASSIESCTSAEEWWRQIVPINESKLCTAMLRPGIIDGKVGFELGPDFCSPEDDRICASGTTAAAFSHNAYFAPGATIGLAMSTGRAVATTLSGRNREREELSAAVAQIYRDTLAPTLFLIGLWVVFVGVLCKSASRVLRLERLQYGHYVLMPLGAAVVTAGVRVAATQPRRVMRDYSDPHVVVGYITVVLMWIQVLDGIFVRSNYGLKRVLLHRVTGSILLGMMGYLYIGATVPPTPLERYDPKWTKPWLLISGIVWALVLGVVVCTGFVPSV